MSIKKETKKTTTGQQKKKPPEQDSFLKAEVIILVSFALAIILFLSNFHLCGVVGDFLREVQLGLFGLMGYVAPIAIFVGGGFYLANRQNKKAVMKLVSVIFFFIVVCALSQLFFGTSIEEGNSIWSYYTASKEFGEGGGLIGGMICLGLVSILGTVGAFLVLAIILVICSVFITEKSVVNSVKKHSETAYKHAKEFHDETVEKRKQSRAEKKAKGVNLGATVITQVPKEEPVAISTPEHASLDMPYSPVSEAISDLEPLVEPQTDPDVFRGEIVLPPEEPGTFNIPEESKRVVTASGKIIDSDSEALQKKIQQRKKEVAEEQIEIQIEPTQPKKEYIFPPIDLLNRGGSKIGNFSEQEYKATAIKLQQTLRNFGVGVTVTNISCGPSVTRYELHPEQGVKVSKIVSLADDIKLNLAAEDIRIEAPIPGKAAVGIEVPNKETTMVFLRELLDSDQFKKHDSKLAFSVGKDIGGQVVVTDIAKMPHLLIAGATGSGKSVCINTLIMSIIFKSSPEDVKMIMIDPKVVELSVYNGIPHLLIPVVTDPKKASGALHWAVAEMTDRYKKFAEHNVRDLKGYNAKITATPQMEGENKPVKLPQIVIIVDELADLMMVAPGEVEDAICRLAQLARAAGIHLVIATQRPSVNVITGLIKANVPSRIAFSVSSGVDSRTIIDMNGAEKLLGKGDMLFYPSGYPKPQRVQGAFVTDSEVHKVVEFLTKQGMTPEYNTEIENHVNAAPVAAAVTASGDGRDEYFEQAGRFIIEKEKASIGMLQRMFKIGFNRAARVVDQLAEAGVVGEEEGTKPRKVLMTIEEFEAFLTGEKGE